jgi:hypothetical protein
MIQAVGVFAALFALDFVWAKYTFAMTEKRPILSGAYASGLIVLSGAAAVGYTQNPWLLIPAALGAFCGTWVAVRA